MHFLNLLEFKTTFAFLFVIFPLCRLYHSPFLPSVLEQKVKIYKEKVGTILWFAVWQYRFSNFLRRDTTLDTYLVKINVLEGNDVSICLVE